MPHIISLSREMEETIGTYKGSTYCIAKYVGEKQSQDN